jgi:hypothetical protein
VDEKREFEPLSIAHLFDSMENDDERESEQYSRFYRKKTDHYKGILDPESTAGKGKFSEYVVASVLGDCVKPDSFRSPFDLKSESLGTIDVKTSKLLLDGKCNHWLFNLKQYKDSKKFIPDYYICLGLNYNEDSVDIVWIFPGDVEEVNVTKLRIDKNYSTLMKLEKYETNVIPYDITFKNLPLNTLREFENLDLSLKVTEKLSATVVERLIESFPVHTQILLSACVTVFHSKKEASTQNVFEEYNVKCRNLKIDPLSDRYIKMKMDELEKMGILVCDTISFGRHGRKSIICAMRRRGPILKKLYHLGRASNEVN